MVRIPRLTADSVTDPDLEILQDGFDLLEHMHRRHEPEGICYQCMSVSPCDTYTLIQNIKIQIIETRQRTAAQEDACPTRRSPTTGR